MIGSKAKNYYNFKSEFETRKDKVVDQYFRRKNDPMSQPSLDSTHLGMNTTNITTSPSDSIPLGTKSTKPTPLKLPMDHQQYKRIYRGGRIQTHHCQIHLRNIFLSNDTYSSKSKKKKHNKEKRHRKDKKKDLSYPSSSNNSYLFYDIDYIKKLHKRKTER